MLQKHQQQLLAPERIHVYKQKDALTTLWRKMKKKNKNYSSCTNQIYSIFLITNQVRTLVVIFIARDASQKG